MRVLIIDDERLAREELRGLLESLPGAEIVGEAATADEGIDLAATTRPDVVFLDIEMPEKSGFDFVAHLPPPHPQLVFVTAYDAHALRAFEVNAIDYLLKPVVPERLAATWRRLAGGPAIATPDRLPVLREDDQVFLRDDDRCWFVPVRQIRLLEGGGNHTRVHFDSARPLLHRTLASMEERLPASLFLRANRNQLINRLFIARVEPWFSGCIKATLTDGTTVEFSRRQSQQLRDRLGL